jgi:hypothetical protein
MERQTVDVFASGSIAAVGRCVILTGYLIDAPRFASVSGHPEDQRPMQATVTNAPDIT